MSFIDRFKKGGDQQQKQTQQVNLPPQQVVTIEKKVDNNQKAHQKGKPGGGWGSDEENDVKVDQFTLKKKGKPDFKSFKKDAPKEQEQNEVVQQEQVSQQVPNTQNNSQAGNQNVAQSSPASKNNQSTTTTQSEVNLTRILKLGEFDLLEGDDLDQKKIEYENKIVNDVIQAGGARQRQSDAILNNFMKASESLQVPIIGSLLISKFFMDLSLIQKIRAVFASQELVKKNKKFQEYFKYHIQLIKQSPPPLEDTQQNYLKEINYLSLLVDNPNALNPTNKIDGKFNFATKNNIKTTNGNKNNSDLIDLDDGNTNLNNNNQQKENNLIDANDLLGGINEINIQQQNLQNNINQQNGNDNNKGGKLNAFNFIKKKNDLNQNVQINQQQPQFQQQNNQNFNQFNNNNQNIQNKFNNNGQQQNQVDYNQRYQAFDLF